MWFTRVSIMNPVLATMVMLAFVVMGLIGMQKLRVDQFPSVEFPTVVAQIDYPGAAPEIVETEVTRKVEEAVNTIAGINQLISRSYEGVSVVIVQFNLNLDGRKAADDVREKLALVKASFRDEVKEPRVSRFDPASRPIFSLAVTSRSDKPDAAMSAQSLTVLADQVLKKRLENVRGVGAVSIVGGVKREINLYLKPAAMESLGVSVDQVIAAVRSENQELPAGAVRGTDTERVVQIQSRVASPRDFGDIVVARRGTVANAQPIKLGQVADVVDGAEELESLALYNGQRTILLEVQKSQGENTIEVVDGLLGAVGELRKRLPEGVQLEVVRDGSRPIRLAVKNVQRTLIEGAILTIAIVFLFLNSWRSTVITGLTLPIALVGTFAFMHAFGFTINMITLMALSLCVGLLIDDAIVVRENIVRHVQMGKAPVQASIEGTQEIGLAVLATTLSIVAVFLPIGFMGGIIGKFFHEFGITIVAAVLISMFVSFTLDPMLSSVWHDPAIDREGQPFAPKTWYDHTFGRLTHAVHRFSQWLARAYEAMLAWSLDHRKSTIAMALATLALSLILARSLGTEFVPKADFGETSVSFSTPVGTPLAVTEARARQVEAALREFSEVRYTVVSINTGQAQGRSNAMALVRLVDRQDRKLSAESLAGPMRERLSRIAGITINHVGLLDTLQGSKPLSLSVQGPDLATLQRLSNTLVAQLAKVPGIIDVDSSMKANRPTVGVLVKREAAADLGLSVGVVSNTLRAMMGGVTVGAWRAEDDQSYDVKVRVQPSDRDASDDLLKLGIMAGTNADGSARIVRLSQVADIKLGAGANQINRRDMQREVEFTANVKPPYSLGEVSASVRQVLEQSPLPQGYTVRVGGASKDMKESFDHAITALMMGVIFIYMILASQFKSFVQPLALMTSLPLTLIGVVAALLMFGSTMNLFSVIGVVMLMGLVTKNAILLVDFALRERQAGVERREALLNAAKVRLRPILMTTLAMVFGMVPLALALSAGSEQRAPMGQAVIGGVITSSLLTLVVVPVVYTYLDDLTAWLALTWKRWTRTTTAAAAGE